MSKKDTFRPWGGFIGYWGRSPGIDLCPFAPFSMPVLCPLLPDPISRQARLAPLTRIRRPKTAPTAAARATARTDVRHRSARPADVPSRTTTSGSSRYLDACRRFSGRAGPLRIRIADRTPYTADPCASTCVLPTNRAVAASRCTKPRSMANCGSRRPVDGRGRNGGRSTSLREIDRRGIPLNKSRSITRGDIGPRHPGVSSTLGVLELDSTSCRPPYRTARPTGQTSRRTQAGHRAVDRDRRGAAGR